MDFYISTIKLLLASLRGVPLFKSRFKSLSIHPDIVKAAIQEIGSSTVFKKATTRVVLYIVTSNVLISNSVVMISMHNNIQTLYPCENLLQITSPIFFITHSLLTQLLQVVLDC